MAQRWRLRLGTLILVVFTLGLALGLYLILPPIPIWTLEVAEEIGGTSPDGTHFFTTALPTEDGHKQYGPTRLRECRTGREVKSFFEAGTHLQRLTVSDDRRLCAAIVEPDQVCVVDLVEQRSWSLTANDVNPEYALHFAPDGRMIHVRAAHVKLPNRSFLFELPSGELFAKPETILSAQFSENGRYLVTLQADGTHLWDRAARKDVGNYLDQREFFHFSPDGRRLLTSPEPAENEPFRPVLWNLGTHRRVAELPVELRPDVGYRYIYSTFSPDARWLVTWHEHERDGNTLEVWDAASGQRVGRHDLNPKHRRSLVLAPDSSGLVVIDLIDWGKRGIDGAFAVTMLDLPSAKVRWQHHFAKEKTRLLWNGPNGAPGIGPKDIRFTPDNDAVSIFVARQAEWKFLDARTGHSRTTARSLEDGAICFRLDHEPIGPDQRRFLVQASLHQPPPPFIPAWLERRLPLRARGSPALLLDGSNGAEISRLQLPSRIQFVSADGQCLLTMTYLDVDQRRLNRLQAWSVPPGRAWLQIIGIPLAVGMLLMALGKIWRWRKRSGGGSPKPM